MMESLCCPENRAGNYKEVCQLALLVGEIMAAGGAESYRVEDTARRILRTTGFELADAHATVTGLTLTLSDPALDQPICLTKRIESRVNHLGKIALANEVSRRFVSGDLTAREATELLRHQSRKRYYPAFLTIFCFAPVSACYSVIFGGTPRDALAGAVVGLLVGVIYHLLQKLRPLGFVLNFLAALVLGFSCVAMVMFIPVGQHLRPLISGCMMPLVPGIALTVAIRDLLWGDYLSGVSRGIEAAICASFLAAGVSIVVRFYEGDFQALSFVEPAIWFVWGQNWFVSPEILFQAFCSFVSSVGLAILFHAKPEHLLPCGITGGVTWFVYCLVNRLEVVSALPILLAALTASFLSYILARIFKTPVTVIFTGGIFCLVPGEGIFRTMYYILGFDYVNGAACFMQTLKTSALIAVAIAVQGSLVSLFTRKEKS